MIVFRGGVRLADEVTLNVTPTVIAGATLHLQPSTTTIKQGAYTYIPVTLGNGVTQVSGLSVRHTADTTGTPLINTYHPYISDPLTRATIAPPSAAFNYVQANVGAGSAYVYAEVNAYGTILRDSVLFHFAYPSSAFIAVPGTQEGFTIAPTANHQTLNLNSGASVLFANFLNASGVMLDVTFSDSTAVIPATNIHGLGQYSSASRKFNIPGTYTWTITVSGPIALYNAQTFTGKLHIQ